MKPTVLALIALLSSVGWSVLPTRAKAGFIYFLPRPVPSGLEAVTVRALPGGNLLMPRGGSTILDDMDLEAIEVPEGTEVFAVRLSRGHEDLIALTRLATLLRVVGNYAVVAVDTAHIDTPWPPSLRREHLDYIPPVSAVAERGLRAGRAIGGTTTVDPQVKQDLVDAVSVEKWSQYVRELSGNLAFQLDGELRSTDNRHITKPGIQTAQDYLESRFRAMGYEVLRQDFMVGITPCQNIIAVKTGVTHPGEIIVIGSHHDSLSEDIDLRAPGAEDDASGTAGVLCLAELIAAYDTERTIHFACFSGEEEGIFGSQYYVSHLGSNGWNVIDAMVLDEISTWQSNFAAIIEGEHAWEPLMSLFVDNLVQYSGIPYREDYYSWGSDHVPFQQAGIPAFIAINMDYNDYPYWESINDRWLEPCPSVGRPCMDPTLAHEILKAAAATMADLTVPTKRVPTASVSFSRLKGRFGGQR
jgi:hypothetical protein